MNKFKIKSIKIDCKIKKNFYVYEEIDGKEEIVIADNDTEQNKKVMKLLAIDTKDNKAYPIKLTQYKEILDAIKAVSNNYIEDLNNGVYIMRGFYNNIQTNVEVGEKVEISDIDIIDKYKLYNKSERISTVINCNNNKYTIKIDKTGETVTTFRDKIRKTQSLNYRTFIDIV
jgi:hypothetical protein